MGHTCDDARCQTSARKRLETGAYSYVLLDLQIPVRYGRKPLIQNGQNLLEEIRRKPGLEDLPVLVMTAHGLEGPDLAVEVMRDGRATDFIKKPFPSKGDTLEKRIKSALAKAGRARPGASKRSVAAARAAEPQTFEAGEMVFYPSRVELEGVKICGEPDSRRRKILNELRRRDARNRFIAYGGEELAEKIGCRDRGQNGVAEAVRDFRKHVTEVMRDEANLVVEPRDVVESGGRGYRFTEKITVKDGDDPASGPRPDRGHDADGPDDTENDPVNDPDGGSLNERQEWVLEQLKAGKHLRIGELMKRFPRSKTTAKRDLADLRHRGLIEFDGSARTGFWRAKRPRQADSRKR
jgi:DNA-binding response OmpR family regulator